VILATAPDSKSIAALVDRLGPNGKLVIVGRAPEPLVITPLTLNLAHRSIQGWSSGTTKETQDTLQFSALTGIRPMTQKYPLEKAADAYDQMIRRRAGFRSVDDELTNQGLLMLFVRQKISAINGVARI
jgi:D-arabinose 1-dehydrogenase-like Zn-dependent alcohol dehydrogenase